MDEILKKFQQLSVEFRTMDCDGLLCAECPLKTIKIANYDGCDILDRVADTYGAEEME